MTYSQKLSHFISDLEFDGLPPSVVQNAKRHLLDVIGVGLIGSRQGMARRAIEGVASIPGSHGDCCVWGRGETFSAPYAALANGVAAHCLDFDDTHTDAITHGSAVLGPLVLALGEELNAHGADAILAFVAGWEVAARVGLASRGSFHKRGFHTTSVAGVFGAVAAAAKLMGLTAEQTSHAFGLAGSQVSGVSEYLSDGSSPKSFHPGWAAHAGLIATHLAQAGMTGPATVFEGRYGLFQAYGMTEESEFTMLTAGLGERWEVERISIKPYPCCHFAHAFLDCAKELRRQGVHPAQVEELRCIVPEIEVPLICEPMTQKLRPDSPYAAKFSLPFLVAAALTDGAISHQTFTPDNIRRKDLLELASRVTYRKAQPGETSFPKYFPGWIQGRLRGGRKIEQRLDINYGNPDNPMNQADVEEKFCTNAQEVIPATSITLLLAQLRSLEQIRVKELAQTLAEGILP